MRSLPPNRVKTDQYEYVTLVVFASSLRQKKVILDHLFYNVIGPELSVYYSIQTKASHRGVGGASLLR